jgi:hypothetical protein
MKRLLFAFGIIISFLLTVDGQEVSFSQRNNTGGNFEPNYSIDNKFLFPRNNWGVIPIDFDGDSLKDIILPFYYGPQNNYDVSYLRFFKNMGSGNLKEVTSKFINTENRGKYYVGMHDLYPVIFDFNKDGLDDFFISDGWENNDYSNYDSIYGVVKFRDYFYTKNNIGMINKNGAKAPSFFYQKEGGLKKGIDLFDKKTFGWNGAAAAYDIDNDSWTDLIINQGTFWGCFIAEDSTIVKPLDGISIWKNNNGKGFILKQHIYFTDTVEKYTFQIDDGNLTIADFNNDGYSDILVNGNKIPYTTESDSSIWSVNYKHLQIYNAHLETRLYQSDKGVFNEKNYTIINKLRTKCNYAIDLNSDGKSDFISLWSNSSFYPKGYLDSTNNLDAVNTQLYAFINKGNNVFEDQTASYFPNDTYKFSRISIKELKLVDLNNDGFIDLFPETYKYDSMYSRYGVYAQDMPGSMATVYYKNINNKYFQKCIIDTFFNQSNWKKYPDFKDQNTLYNFYTQNNQNQQAPINGKYLLDENTFLNSFIIDDFNNDKKIDFFGLVPGSSGGKQNYFQDKYKDFFNSGFFSIIYQCNTSKPLFNTSKFSFCSGDSIKLTVTNINRGDTLKWYFGTKSDLTNVTNKIFTDSTKIFVTRTDTLGCIISSDTVQIKKYSIPNAPILSRDTANFLLSGTTGTNWYKDGVFISDTTQKYKPAAPGSYTAKTTYNGCTSAMSTAYYYLVTDIINLGKDEFIKLAPNPFVNQLNFDFIIKGYQRLNIDVFDISTGAKIASQSNITAGTNMSLGYLSIGAYIIRVTSNDNKVAQQFKMVKL